MGYLKRCKMKVLECPSQIPDLNIIENLWVDLKRTVHARRLKNIAELKAFCGEEQEKIPNTTTERLLVGYEKCLQTARGGVTRY